MTGEKDMLKSVKRIEKYLFGVAMIFLVVLALIAAFTDTISLGTLALVAFVLSALAIAKTYYGWLAPRLAIVFVAGSIVLTAGAYWVSSPQPDSSKYQAVFLSNGQVYFGHLKNPESANPVLENVYYLQSNSQNPQQNTQQNNQNLQLVKLGNELHAPESKMVLRGDQILFWENLKDSGKVVQAIKQQK